MGGVGKTELAYAAAHRLANIFPDAQIRVDLHGADQRRLEPEQALQRIVQTLEPQAQPADDLAAVEATYRSLLTGKRVLIIADDAHSAAQVRALMPPPGSALLITSRNHFVLPRIMLVELDMPPEAEADRAPAGHLPAHRGIRAGTRAVVRPAAASAAGERQPACHRYHAGSRQHI